MDKFACMLVNSDQEFEMIIKESESQNVDIERGLKASLKSNLHKELSTMFNQLSKAGYHVTGFILDDKGGIEFLYQRNPEQKIKLKEVEVDNKYAL